MSLEQDGGDRTVAAVIPALDEVESIADVVAATAAHVDMVIVVDDGSTDGTGAAAEAAGARVVRHAVNLGVGAAIASGLSAARDAGATIIVQVDGDGQHDAACIPHLIERIVDGADLVVGTRFELGFAMSPARRTILRAFATVMSRRIGSPISDPTSGYRAFSATAADRLAPVFPRKYLSDTVEVLFIADELGLEISTIPVRMRERQGGEASVGPLRGIGYTLRMLAIIGRHTVRRSGSRAR